MTINVGQLLRQLRQMTVPELRQKHAEVFGEPARSSHKQHLLRRIAWRVQALDEGDMEERAGRLRDRALQIANDADLRLRAPAPGNGGQEDSGVVGATRTKVTRGVDLPADDRLPMPGTLLIREYRGQTLQVRVLSDGFDYEGTVYRSLSAVAKAITGSHWNGYLFFGLESSKQKNTTVIQP